MCLHHLRTCAGRWAARGPATTWPADRTRCLCCTRKGQLVGRRAQSPSTCDIQSSTTRGASQVGSSSDRASHTSSVVAVGTGRCGSTMLSHLLGRHPDILSLSEVFEQLLPRSFEPGQFDGEALVNLLHEPRPLTSTLYRHGLTIPEFLYPVSSGARFTPETGVPPLLVAALPHLTSDYEQLYDDVIAFASLLRPAPLADHYRRLFQWLCERLKRRVWIERSGGSLRYVDKIREYVPNAALMHIIRDGRECAMSLSRHQSARLFVIGEQMARYLGANPYLSDQPIRPQHLPQELVSMLPDRFEPHAFLSYNTPIEAFGELWSKQVSAGVPILDQLPKRHVLTLTYERFQREPEAALRKVLDFLELQAPPDEWVKRTAALVRPAKAPTWTSLSPDESARLTEACSAGFNALQESEYARDALSDWLPCATTV